MRLFLSWSGDLSHRVAKAFAEWIPDVINAIEPWLSSAHIEAGSAWNSELQNQLRCCEFGVFFVTARNDQSPWLQFEFGALASRLENTCVCPYLVDIRSAQVPAGPLTQFQATQADKTGTWSLVSALNRKLGDSALREDRLQRMYDRLWPDLSKEIADAIEQDGDEDPPARSESSMIEETLLLTRRLNHRLDLKTWSLRHTGPEGTLQSDASQVQPDEPVDVGVGDNLVSSRSPDSFETLEEVPPIADSFSDEADLSAPRQGDDVFIIPEISAVDAGDSANQAILEPAEYGRVPDIDSVEFDEIQSAKQTAAGDVIDTTGDDDSYAHNIQTEEHEFSETVQWDPSALAGEEDHSFAQRLATSGLPLEAKKVHPGDDGVHPMSLYLDSCRA